MQSKSKHLPKLTEAEEAVRLLRIWDVMAMTGYTSRDTIYRLIKAEKFPPQRKLHVGGRASGWTAWEIREYVEGLQAVPTRQYPPGPRPVSPESVFMALNYTG